MQRLKHTGEMIMYSYSELSNTVLRSIKEVLGLSVNPLLTDNLISKFDADELDMIEIIMSVEEYLDVDWGIRYERIYELDLTAADLINDLAVGLKVPIDQEVKSETYTQSELSYITELEDRIEYLQELCSDYAKIIEEKESNITVLQQLTRFQENQLKTVNKSLCNFERLTTLLSTDQEVLNMLNARVGEDVVDVIIDYLMVESKKGRT